MNRLLNRQLKRHKIDVSELPENLIKFLNDISQSYDHHEVDRSLIERSIDISSQELNEVNKKLRLESERQKIVLQNLKTAIQSLPIQEEIMSPSKELEEEDLISISNFLAMQIQKRKDAENKLKLYERAINSSSNGIIITDPNLPDNPMIFCNPAFLQMTGYDEVDVIGKNCRFLQGDDLNQSELMILRNAIKEKKSCSVTLRNFKKDGTLFWNELKISPIFNNEGNITHYIGIQSDITERINTAIKLQESNARITELLQNIASGILVEDEHRRIALVNSEFCKIFSIPAHPDQLIGADCSQAAEQSKNLFQNPDEFVSRIEIILREKRLVKNEELILKDGTVFERDFVPIFISDNYKGHLWNYRDITSRKQAEFLLKESENYARSLISNFPDLLFVLSKDGIFLDFKAEPTDLYVTPDMFLNKSYKAVLPSNVSEIMTKAIDEIKYTNNNVEFNYNILVDDQEKYFTCKAIPFGENKIIFFARNITNLKKNEIILQQERQLLKTIIDIIPDPIYVKDINGRKIVVNKAEVNALGALDEKEVIGKDDSHFYLPDVVEKTKHEDELVISTGLPVLNQEGFVVSKKGFQEWFIGNKVPFKDSEGKIIGIVGISHNITNRKKIEEALKESEARYKLVVNSINQVIFQIDQKARWVFLNQAWTIITGFSVEESLGKNMMEFIVDGNKIKNFQFFRPLMKREIEFYRSELKCITKNGDYKWIEVVASLSTDSNGRIIGANGTLTDITERKIIEAQLQELKTFYEKTLNDLPGQIAVFDNQFRYIYVNPSSIANQEIRNWIIGKDDFDYCTYRKVDTSIAEDRRKWLIKVKNEKAQIKFDETIVKNSNEQFYFERSISPILDSNGEVKHLLAYGVDITERKNTELELLKIKNQLESVLNTVGEGIITVDENGIIVLINKEIEKIYGWKRDEILGKDLTLLMPQKYRDAHHSGMKRYNLSRSSNVLGKLLTMEGLKKDGSVFPLQLRIQETLVGEKTFFTASMNDITELNNLVKDLEISNKALTDFAYIASHDLREPLRKISAFGSLLSKSLKGKLDDDDQENLTFMIEGAKRMQQMVDDLLYYSKITAKAKSYSLINLDELLNEIINFDLAQVIEDNNAKIYIENKLGSFKGEKTQIKQLFQNLIGNGIKYRKKTVTPVIKIKSINTSTGIEVYIEDNGIGIDEKYREQIFEMFKRLHSKEEYEGSGIGLAVCKKIIELYKGEISSTSVSGSGSTFVFRLPVKE